jgi:hypothetical protein
MPLGGGGNLAALFRGQLSGWLLPNMRPVTWVHRVPTAHGCGHIANATTRPVTRGPTALPASDPSPTSPRIPPPVPFPLKQSSASVAHP